MTTKRMTRLLGIAVAAIAGIAANASAESKPLKVYILAGQSNMQGSAHKRTFAAIGDDPKTAGLLGEILDGEREPVVCDDAWITYLTGGRGGDTKLKGRVKVGYGFDRERIGPEYGFGVYMDKALDEPILLIKTAWGGKSLAVDFRPPSAGPYVPSAKEKERGQVPDKEQVGHYYRQMIRFVRATLKDAESVKAVVPSYDAKQGYELAGFVWFQGWNDMCNRHHLDQYTVNMIHFISDVRKELDAPALPFIVGILGVYGTDPDSRKFDKWLPASAFRKAQFAAVEQYDQKVASRYRGNVIAVDSGPYYELELSDIYWKRRLTGNWKRRVKNGEMTQEKYREECAQYGFGDGELTADERAAWDRCASNAEYHYLGSGKTFVRFGKALAEAMLELEHPKQQPNEHPAPPRDLWLTYSGGKGPGQGKHVVLIAADQEYRSEQSMPMFAKLLAQRHGFDCTVLFSVNEQGEVDPTLPAPFKDKTKRHNIPGLKFLAKADCVIWLSRFMHLPDEQMKHFHDYFDSGKPLIALRTANHGFMGGKKYKKDGKSVALREMLGGTFMGHHGGWHRESTRGVIVPENKTHPILMGVDDIWGTSDVYRCHNERFPFPDDCTSLVLGQPLVNLKPDAPPNTKKQPLPIAWTKTWVGNKGRSSRIFHFTMGSAVDFQNAGVRRLTVNAVYWGLGMEKSISPESSVEIVGDYKPLKAGFNYEKLGVKPRRVEYYK